VDFTFTNSFTITPGGTTLTIYENIEETSTDDSVVDIGTIQELEAMREYSSDTDFRLVKQLDGSVIESNNWNETSTVETSIAVDNNTSTPNTYVFGHSLDSSGITVDNVQTPGVTASDIDYTVVDTSTGEVEFSTSATSEGTTLAIDLSIDLPETVYSLSSIGGSYSGTFYGNGYTIGNLTIYNDTGNAGLIGDMDGGTVQNTGFSNATVKSYGYGPKSSTAIVSSKITNSATIKNISLTVSTVELLNSKNGTGNEIGLLVGVADGQTTIENIYATNCTVDGSSLCGGLIGFNGDSSTSLNKIDMESSNTVSGYEGVGGVIGFSSSGSIQMQYVHCRATVEASGNQFVGGLSARGEYDIDYSMFSGSVNASNAQYVGGLVGKYESGEVNESISVGSVTGNADVGGVAGEFSSGAIYSSVYWDTSSSPGTGQSDAVGTTGGGATVNAIGLTTDPMQGNTALDAGNMENLDENEWTTRSSDYPYPTKSNIDTSTWLK
jgi:hypothetical protein